MGMVAPRQQIASAFFVIHGGYGAVSRYAQERGVCRQWVYREAASLTKRLTEKEARAARKVKKLLRKGTKLGRAIAQAKSAAEDHVDDKAIIRSVDKRYREVIRLGKMVDPSNTATIHRMRLAFKKFRYTAEVWS